MFGSDNDFLGESPTSWALFILFIFAVLAGIHYVLDVVMER